ncbi:MAG: hypothetical protein IPK82_38080 [Polyangiaceae bacterium]|nr:hypothetical protein [Polyangiaceae bacterium]
MVPDLHSFLSGYALFAHQHGFSASCDRERLANALDEARALSATERNDEPAALFFALARRPRLLGAAHGRMTLHVAIAQAHALGFDLNVDAAVLELMRARVVRNAIDFAELRTWFAEHLAPISHRLWPPR